jgi:hypothetical protein
MNEELEALKVVTRRLNEAEIPYMISGSIARFRCSIYGLLVRAIRINKIAQGSNR